MENNVVTKPKLFISHSTSGLPETDRCAIIRDRLNSVLSDDGWDVFLDKLRIKPGDQWRSEILYNLAHAQAGIILFNEKATESDWVMAEALILCFRKSRDPKFQIIPVLLDDKKPDDTCLKRYEPFELNKIQAYRDKSSLSPEESACEIAGKFDLKKVELQETNRWMDGVINLLENVKDNVLKRAAKELESNIEANGSEGHDMLLWTVVQLLHHKPISKGYKAFIELSTQLKTEEVSSLGFYLITKWIENEAAEILLCASKKPDEIGLLTINADKMMEIDLYIDRTIIEIPQVQKISVTGAGGDNNDAKLHRIKKTMYEEVFPGRKYDIYDKNEELAKENEFNERIANMVVMCVLPFEYANEQVLRELREKYSRIIFLVMVGSQAENMKWFNSLNGKPLNPPLTDEKRKELENLGSDVKNIIKNVRRRYNYGTN